MILSTQHELRLYSPNNAIDDVTIWAGYLDESEKDFLVDKLGTDLYDRLCEYYESIDPEEYYQRVLNGTYKSDPWKVLLRNVQVMVVNYTLYRNYFSLILSINGTSINIVQSNDFGPADQDLLKESVQEYKVKAFTNLNTLLSDLEKWAKSASELCSDEESDGVSTPKSAISEIVTLWKKSHYYYEHSDLLIPTCNTLMQYIDIRESREKFIRLLPDLRFIQRQYIAKTVGTEEMKNLIALSEQGDTLDKDSAEGQYLDDVRYLMTAYLEQRTQVLTIDKVRRQQAHDEAISLKENILAYLKAKEQPSSDATEDGVSTPTSSTDQGYKNNAEGSRIFVSPLLY